MRKKKLLSFMLALAGIFNFAVQGTAADTATPAGSTKTVSVTAADGSKTFLTTPSNIPLDAVIVLACYEGGAITEVQTAPNENKTIPFIASKPFDTVKVMAWDSLSGMIPLCRECEVLDFSGTSTITLDLGLFGEDIYENQLASDETTLYKTATEDGVTTYITDGASLYFLESEDAVYYTKYKLDKNVKLYVNGVQISTVDQTAIEKYIVANDNAEKVKLTDSDADGKYDVISTDYFATAMVDSVNSEKIVFTDKIVIDRSSLTLNKEDLEYHIYYNDEEITIADLAKGDILSIAYDIEKGSAESDFFEIYVSRDVRTGVMTGQDDEEEIVTVGGESYSFAKSYPSMKSSMTMGSEYKIYLDIFGRIFYLEIKDASVNLAIIDRFYEDSDGGQVGEFYFPDGTTQILEIDNAKVGMNVYDIRRMVYWDGNVSKSNKTPIQNRVVEYKISSVTNKVIKLEFLNPAFNLSSNSYNCSRYESLTINTYNAKTNSIGDVQMNSATKVIDATEYYNKWRRLDSVGYKDLEIGTVENTFIDKVEYVAMGFGTKYFDGAYPLVIVLEGQGTYTEDTKLAVVNKALTTTMKDDGSEGYQIEMYYDGEKTTRFISDDTVVDRMSVTESNYSRILKKGDVIAFVTNKKGDIEQIDVVFAASTISLGKSYKDMYTESFAAMSSAFAYMISVPSDAKYWTAFWDDEYSSDYSTSLIYGVVTDKKDSYFQLGKVATGTVDSYTGLYTDLDAEVEKDGAANRANSNSNNGGVMDISLTDETRVYIYDYDPLRNERYALYAGTNADIIATSVPNSQIVTAADGHEYIMWDMVVDTTADGEITLKEANDIYFAFAKVVDGTATEVFIIYAE